ncbi:hypothetical protein IFM89_010517 [Coptis chinensis]|uniref:Uncharacterized protein n=1 Tax=Coptis chinensis TaxID=261450 RepID=A0A835HVA0_9MAGN|nr:hypothetical protein IFM89_010517 [Coptis chinensis]
MSPAFMQEVNSVGKTRYCSLNSTLRLIRFLLVTNSRLYSRPYQIPMELLTLDIIPWWHSFQAFNFGPPGIEKTHPFCDRFEVPRHDGEKYSICMALGRPELVTPYQESMINPDNAGEIVNPKGEIKVSAITDPIGKECADLWPRIASAANVIVRVLKGFNRDFVVS